jgi:hypothetical protein
MWWQSELRHPWYKALSDEEGLELPDSHQYGTRSCALPSDADAETAILDFRSERLSSCGGWSRLSRSEGVLGSHVELNPFKLTAQN